MSDVTSFLNEAASAHQKLSNEARRMADKWEKSGLLEGLEGHERNSMAVLLENQAGQLLNEASATQTTAGLESWAGVALPLVRKVLGQIAAKNFVSVQPMNLPAGLVFFMDFQYGTAQGDRALNESIYGDTTSSSAPQDGFYGAGRFAYSSKPVVANAAAVGAVTQATASATDLDFEETASGTVFATYTFAHAGLTNPDLNAVRSWVPSGSGMTSYLPQFTKLDGANVVFVAPLASTLAGVTYTTQPVQDNRGDFEDRDPIQGGSSPDGTNLNIPEINIQLRSETIAAKTRKLKAVWSPELAQDLNAYHSIDAEAELTAMLSDHISLEIDLEILDMLIVNATTTDYWSAKIGDVWNGSSFTSINTGTAWTNMTWFQTLGQKMQRVSNRIHQLTLRGGANFAVVSPTVATILETIPGFMAGTNGDKMEFAAGVSQVGSFQNRFQIYKNPYMTENIVLMGFRGANFLETGAVYAPYIPLLMTPLVYDPDNFTPRRGVMTRYAKKVVRPEFFGKVVIDGLEFV